MSGSILAETMASEAENHVMTEFQRKCFKKLKEKGTLLSQEAARLTSDNLSMYLSRIVSQDELHEIQYIADVLSLQNVDEDTLQYDLKAMIEPLKESIESFADYKFFNTEKIDYTPSRMWKPAD